MGDAETNEVKGEGKGCEIGLNEEQVDFLHMRIRFDVGWFKSGSR